MGLHETSTVKEIRALSGVNGGPPDASIADAVEAFVGEFEKWYVKVMREAVPEYRRLVVKRINPFVRRLEFDGLDVSATARRLVGDYNSRNFVTAGGWAIEALAASGRPEVHKSGIPGIDLDRHDAAGNVHLYVLKSGTVTRNSDIMAALKRNARQAEKQLRQSQQTKGVNAYYAIAAGQTASTFEDGVWRPSSGEFWGHMFDLPEEDAVEMALAIAAVAGRLVRRDVTEHLDALELLVGSYIAEREDPASVDWEFIARLNMQKREQWLVEDKARHEDALRVLEATGYTMQPKAKAKPRPNLRRKI